MGVKFIVCHDTGNAGATAQNNTDFYIRSANETQASAHTFIDDKGVIEVIPDFEKAWHVRYDNTLDNSLYGDDANDIALGIELCYGGKIDTKIAYANYVEYIALKCTKFNLDPLKQLIGHYKLDPARRTDPLNAFKTINITWEQFVSDVKAKTSPIPKVEMVSIDIPKDKLQKVLDFLKTI